MELCDIGVAIDGDASLQKFRDCHGVVTVAMRHKTCVDAACPEAAADLNPLEGYACVKEQAGLAIPDEVGVAAAPGRYDLDVHRQNAMPSYGSLPCSAWASSGTSSCASCGSASIVCASTAVSSGVIFCSIVRS